MEEYDTDDKYLYLFDDRELDELSNEPLKILTEEEKEELAKELAEITKNPIQYED